MMLVSSKILKLRGMERDVIAGMKLSEPALARFLDEEPDLYTIKDARSC